MQKLILVRGISGSGKTWLAKSIIRQADGMSENDDGRITGPLEADSFFMDFSVDPPKYFFNAQFLGDAHQFCKIITTTHLFRGRSVLVSNTSTTAKEVRTYAELAKRFRIPIEIVNTATPWAKNPEECYQRNTHRVPLEVIKNQLARYLEIPDGVYDPEELIEKYLN